MDGGSGSFLSGHRPVFRRGTCGGGYGPQSGFYPVPWNSDTFVAQELGYFEEAGLNVELLEFSDGSAMMEAFAAGELDVAMGGIGPAATGL